MPMRTISTSLPIQGFDDPASPLTEGALHAASTLWALGPQLDQIKLDRQRYADSQNEAAAGHGVASGNNPLWDAVGNRVQAQQDAATKRGQDQTLWERQHQTDEMGFRALQEQDRMDEADKRLAEEDLNSQSLDRYRQGRVENAANRPNMTENELWGRAEELGKAESGADPITGKPLPVKADRIRAIHDDLRTRAGGAGAALPQPPHSAETNPAARQALDLLEPGGAAPRRAPLEPSLSSPGHPAFSSPGPAPKTAEPGLWDRAMGTPARPGSAYGGSGDMINTPHLQGVGPGAVDDSAPPEWQAAKIDHAGMDKWAELYQQEPPELHNASPQQVQEYAQSHPYSFTGQMFKLKAAGDPRYKVVLQELARRGAQ